MVPDVVAAFRGSQELARRDDHILDLVRFHRHHDDAVLPRDHGGRQPVGLRDAQRHGAGRPGRLLRPEGRLVRPRQHHHGVVLPRVLRAAHQRSAKAQVRLLVLGRHRFPLPRPLLRDLSPRDARERKLVDSTAPRRRHVSANSSLDSSYPRPQAGAPHRSAALTRLHHAPVHVPPRRPDASRLHPDHRALLVDLPRGEVVRDHGHKRDPGRRVVRRHHAHERRLRRHRARDVSRKTARRGRRDARGAHRVHPARARAA